MGILTSLETQLEALVGPLTDAEGKQAINDAQGEICIVKWDFLYEDTKTIATVADQTKYALDSTFFQMDRFYITVAGVKSELIEATVDDITQNGLSTTGAPGYFAMGGVKSDLPAVHFGLKTPDAVYTINYGFWKKLADMVADSAESDISKAYKDKPIVSGAAYFIYKNRELLEDAQGAKQDFMIDMEAMAQVKGYTGPSYSEIIAEQGKT